uniref:Uncharacterized protein n=1 Tax=Angiostrongylus cantonensis TaxID=6313 RepID=A0A0K0D457_ANGCA
MALKRAVLPSFAAMVTQLEPDDAAVSTKCSPAYVISNSRKKTDLHSLTADPVAIPCFAETKSAIEKLTRNR